jgi:hypothetical protein
LPSLVALALLGIGLGGPTIVAFALFGRFAFPLAVWL